MSENVIYIRIISMESTIDHFWITAINICTGDEIGTDIGLQGFVWQIRYVGLSKIYHSVMIGINHQHYGQTSYTQCLGKLQEALP